jgi:gas vesicle protein
MRSKNILYTALLAAAAGVAIGILMAPAAGKDTRKKLLKAAISAKDTLHYALLQGSELMASATKKEAGEVIEA